MSSSSPTSTNPNATYANNITNANNASNTNTSIFGNSTTTTNDIDDNNIAGKISATNPSTRNPSSTQKSPRSAAGDREKDRERDRERRADSPTIDEGMPRGQMVGAEGEEKSDDEEDGPMVSGVRYREDERV